MFRNKGAFFLLSLLPIRGGFRIRVKEGEFVFRLGIGHGKTIVATDKGKNCHCSLQILLLIASTFKKCY